MITYKTYITSAFASLLTLSVFAQKLPDTQEQSKWESNPVKIDGKIENLAFEAYNKNTKLNYTLSNDAKNLYLVIQSTDANKILLGGISFTVNISGKKKDKDVPVITFPVIVRQSRGQGGQRGQGGFGGQRMGQGGSGTIDSAAILERRKQQIAQFKEIKITGIPTITDTLISIYNEYGIKAAMSFDIKGLCSYEMSIPLNLLGINLDKPKELAYNIQVNGRQLGGNFGGGGFRAGNGGTFGGGGAGNGGANRGNFDLSMFEPTYFWAKYLPVKQ